MRWQSFKQKRNTIGIGVSLPFLLKIKYRKYDRQRSMNYMTFRKPYAKFLFNSLLNKIASKPPTQIEIAIT